MILKYNCFIQTTLMQKFSFFILLILFAGCKPFLRLVNGEHLPQNENYNSLSRFIEENSMSFSPEQCLYLKDKESKRILSGQFHEPGYYVAVPNIFVYNNNFELLNDEALGGCTVYRPELEGKDFYTELLAVSPVHQPSHSLSEWDGGFTDYRGNPFFPFKKNGKAKVIILWSKYKGKKWAASTNFMIETAKKSKAPLEVFYLNMDEYYHL